ncbi:MAG: carbohydrate ABC transporter substrate-binding protein, partial [Lachnospiraceae bacterium]
MKKRVLSALLSTAMVMGLLAGCGSSAADAPAADTSASTEAAATTEAASDEGAAVAAGAEGSVFNIYCWNEEFKSRLTDHYPGYEEVDGTTGKIGDVTVKW